MSITLSPQKIDDLLLCVESIADHLTKIEQQTSCPKIAHSIFRCRKKIDQIWDIVSPMNECA